MYSFEDQYSNTRSRKLLAHPHHPMVRRRTAIGILAANSSTFNAALKEAITWVSKL